MQFQADISDFDSAMKEARQAVKLATSEFNATSSAMDDWGGSTDGLAAKIRQLNAVHDAEKRKLDILQEAYRKTVAEQGENSKAAQDLKVKINNQQAAVNKAKKQVDEYSDKLDDMKENSVSAEKATENLGKVAKGVTTIFAAVGAAAVAVATGFLAMAESSREYRTAMGKVSTAFEDAGLSADQGKQMYLDFYAVLGDQDKSVEAISNLAMLTDNAQALSEWTDIATGVYAKFGDALPVESLTEAANETAKTGALTGALADALNWAGVNEEAFQASLDECTTTQEREALIRETLNDLYTDAGRRYRETNEDIIKANAAQARLTDAMATMGAKAEPILTAVKNGFASVAERIAALLTEVDMQAITDAINNAFSWFVETALPAIQTGIGWVIDNKDLLLALVTGIAAGFAAWTVVQTVTSAVGALSSLKNTIDLVKTGQLALNTALNMNPIGIVITLVAALVAAFIYLWNNCEEFRNFFIGMWEGIKSMFSGVVDFFANAGQAIADYFASAWESVKNAWSAAGGFFEGARSKISNAFASVDRWMGEKFGGAWTAVKNAFAPFVGYFRQIWSTVKGIFSAVKSVLSGNFSDAWASIKGIFAGWGSYFSGLWQQVKNAFANVGSSMLSIGTNIVEGIWSGISGGINWIKNKISGWIGDVLGFIKGLFGIASPSRVMRDEVGKMLGLGMAEGITDSRAAVNGAVRKLGDAALGGLPSAGGGVSASGGVAAGRAINFTQNNYSPKALTRREIYRQTFNALSYAGGG